MMTSLRKKIIAIGGALAYPTISLSPDITKEHFCRKWVLVTGASHGIGRALTEKLISAGANVFLIARSEADLRLLCAKAKQMGSSADYCAIDLRDREKLEQLCQKLRETLPQLDYFFAMRVNLSTARSMMRRTAYTTMTVRWTSTIVPWSHCHWRSSCLEGKQRAYHLFFISEYTLPNGTGLVGLSCLKKCCQRMVRNGKQRVCAIRCSCADSLFTLGSHSDVRCQRTIQALTCIQSN